MAYKTTQIQDDEKLKLNKKRLYKRNQTKLEFKVRRKKELTQNYTTALNKENIVAPMSFYPPIYPIINEWPPVISIPCPILAIPPVPIIINPPLPSPIFQYYPPIPGPPLPYVPPGLSISSGPSIPLGSFISSIPPVSPRNISPCSNFNHSFEISCNTDIDTSAEISQEVEISRFNSFFKDPLETYLNLPKDLFPSARMLAVNPNAIIDELCKETDIENHTSWILDLEFGIPKCPITRPIPIYNVKFNSINCKNTPEAIHPGFESCTENFKKILLFYYDCVISTWYRGYVAFNSDKSVDNFQSWLTTAMQELGMCWP